MGRTWPVAFPTSATTWISHVTIVCIHVRLLMSDNVRLMINSDRSGRRNHSTNRPPHWTNQEAPYVIVYHPRKIFPRVSFSFSKYTPRPPENYAKTKNYNKKTQWKEHVETGWCPINRFSRKISKKFHFQYFKKSPKVTKSNLKNSVGNGVTQVKNRAGEPTAHGMYFCTVCANTLRDEI